MVRMLQGILSGVVRSCVVMKIACYVIFMYLKVKREGGGL